jgi:NADPH-dependent glutamate synthase beta subunit-like oxidoreductase/coenzyme F420-reducing hydrogenase delta subunit/ferredoxin
MGKSKTLEWLGDEAAPVSLKVQSLETSPCTVECPLGTNVKAYVSLIAAGRFQEALEEIRRTNPFPGICGRVCPHPCEEQCRRKEFDQALAIAALKRFVADYELRRAVIPSFSPVPLRPEKVAVIGSGPAGLTCAADLARQGYQVNVFEASPIPGGMLSTGIPAYRLPRDILNVEIAAIQALGVDIKVNTRIGDRISLDQVAGRHRAVFIATGAQRPIHLGIPGEGEVRQGLIDWVSLLKEAALGCAQRPGNRVVVVGGGDTAVDSARVAIRLGAESVQLLYRRSREEMPAHPMEVEDAEAEGITLSFLTTPVRLVVREDRLKAVECIRLRLGAKDDSGRRRPVPVPGSEFLVPCDALIPAIGQQLDSSFLAEGHGLKISEQNLLVVNENTLATSRAGVFAGGDAVSGPATVVEAIAAGHRAACSILRHLRGLPLETGGEGARQDAPYQELALELLPPPRRARNQGLRLPAEDRRKSFTEIEKGLSEAEAIEEAQRCLRCGLCLECRICVGVCQNKQLILEPGDAGSRDAAENMLFRVPSATYREIASADSVPVRYDRRLYRASVITVRIDETLCRGCGVCEETCDYKAIRVVYRRDGSFIARVEEDMCRGCGTCVSVCPTGAIDQGFFSSERIMGQLKEVLKSEAQEPPVLILTCRWSEVLRILPPETRPKVIELMCLGRLSAGDLLRAFELGAAGVLILGCAEEQCHYGFGSRVAEGNLQRLCALLELLGISVDRLRFLRKPDAGPQEFALEVKASIKELTSQAAFWAGA